MLTRNSVCFFFRAPMPEDILMASRVTRIVTLQPHPKHSGISATSFLTRGIGISSHRSPAQRALEFGFYISHTLT